MGKKQPNTRPGEAMVQGRPVDGQKAGVVEGWIVPAYAKKRFPDKDSPCRDVFWTILFYVHLIAAIVLSIVCIASDPGKQVFADQGGLSFCDANDANCTNPTTAQLVGSIWVSAGLALGLAIVWSYWVRKCTKCVIWTMIIVNLLLLIAITVAGVIWTNDTLSRVIIGIIGVIIILLYIWWIYVARSRIAFTVALVHTAMRAATAYWGTYVSTALAIVPMVLLGVLFAYGIAAASEMITNYQAYTTDYRVLGYACYFYLFFSFIYTMTLIGNIALMIISGVVARYLFLGDASGKLVIEDGEPGTDVASRTYAMTSAKLALGKHFGPVAFGSFLVAVITFLKEMARGLQNQAAADGNICLCLLACCAVCILSCIEWFLKFISMWAYIYVAIYGDSFCTAAKRVIKLIGDSGLELLLQYQLVRLIQVSAMLMIGLGIAGIQMLLFAGKVWGDNYSWQFVTFVLIIGFAFGAVAAYVATRPVAGGARTVMICFIEDPACVFRNHPETYMVIADAGQKLALGRYVHFRYNSA